MVQAPTDGMGKKSRKRLLGQWKPVSHGVTSSSDPSQSLPPNTGRGLLQARVLVRMPVPQVTGHGENSPHSDQPP